MWVQNSFGSAPEKEICEKIQNYVNFIQNPQPPNENPVFTQPGQIFEINSAGSYPPELEELIKGEENITSGWIAEIQSFWVSTSSKLFVFHYSMSPLRTADVPSQVVAVSYISRKFVVFHEDSIALFSGSLSPLKSTFSLPKSVKVTHSYKDLCGCYDGQIRQVIVNNSNNHVSLVGSIAKSKVEDPITQIIETPDFYVSLSLKSSISVFKKQENYCPSFVNSFQVKSSNKRSFFKEESIIRIWAATGNTIYALSRTTGLIFIDLSEPKKPAFQPIMTMLPASIFSEAVWTNGFLTACDSSASSDHVTIIRFQPFAAYTTSAKFGTVMSIGVTFNEVIILTSAGVYVISQKQEEGQDNELWTFAQLLAPIWHCSVTEISECTPVLESLQSYKDGSAELLSDVSQYMMFILEDIIALKNSPLVKDFAKKSISEYFGENRDMSFARLRKIAFETKLSTQSDSAKSSNSRIAMMIQKCDEGMLDEKVVLNEIKAIAASKNVPTEFPIYVNFMLRYSFFDELLECVFQWADAMYPDERALAFENANFPSYNIDESASFQLRLLVFQRLNPFLRLALKKTAVAAPAALALKKAIRLYGTTFQYYIVSFFEEEVDGEDVVRFDFPELLPILARKNSRHLPIILLHRGYPLKAFQEYVRQATQKGDVSIEGRIDMLKRAINISPVGVDMTQARKLLAAAQVLAPFINEHADVPRNMFADNGGKLIQKMSDMHEYVYSLKLIAVLGISNIAAIEEFVKQATADDYKGFNEYIRANPSDVISEKDIAKIFYRDNGEEKSIKELLRNGFLPSTVFSLLTRTLAIKGPGALVEHLGEIKSLLECWGEIEAAEKSNVADFLCSLVLELDSRGEDEKASEVREKLSMCFIDNSFKDAWDIE